MSVGHRLTQPNSLLFMQMISLKNFSNVLSSNDLHSALKLLLFPSWDLSLLFLRSYFHSSLQLLILKVFSLSSRVRTRYICVWTNKFGSHTRPTTFRDCLHPTSYSDHQFQADFTKENFPIFCVYCLTLIYP